MKILLDGNKISNQKELYKTLKKQINSKEFYGSNLDALWDVLSDTNIYLEVTILNKELLINNLGQYANTLIKLFNNLNDAGTKVDVIIK